MKSNSWTTYRTRFLVKAKQLDCALSFTDFLGRQHSGRRGDYLVESCDGLLTITPRQIFEDIYVPMGFDPKSDPALNAESNSTSRLKFEPLSVEKVRSTRNAVTNSAAPSPVQPSPAVERKLDTPLRRKIPQPVRPASPRLGLM